VPLVKAILSLASTSPISAFQMSQLPERFESKAMIFPLGDQEGSRSSAGSWVTGVNRVPSGSTSQMSQSPDELEAKAILLPSGDQSGSISAPGSLVSLFRMEPSRLISQRSSLP